METCVRTRFAPSPTGFLHVGSLRTALYSYLFAKKHNGQFLLRIEDTDQSREVQGATQTIIDSLSWAGITFDEGPGKEGSCGSYIQSQRLALYQEHAKKLIDAGHAYYCFCTSERLDEVRARQQAMHVPTAYDRRCRDLSAQEVAQLLTNNTPHVIRMKLPLTGEITFVDLIRGEITIAWHVLDDQVLVKSDGFPTYHLAAIVDDHFMNISHVIRGEEWLPSTPKHLLLYEYFGWQAPAFAHLPLLLNADRSKMSKRQGDVAVEDYRAKGYLPQAMVNFIALLGWNPGDTQEFFTLDELIKEFSLERVGKSGAVFDIQKLNWLNQHYIARMSAQELLPYVKPLLVARGWTTFSDDYIKQVIDLTKDRSVVIPDFVELNTFFFQEPKSFDRDLVIKISTAAILATFKELYKKYQELTVFNAVITEQVLRSYAQELGIGAGKLLQPLRIAITGINQGPSIFHTMEILGKVESLKRFEFALNAFQEIVADKN
jgi:glutamyl-tRNA synthetase